MQRASRHDSSLSQASYADHQGFIKTLRLLERNFLRFRLYPSFFLYQKAQIKA
jgi:hypothetical protein